MRGENCGWFGVLRTGERGKKETMKEKINRILWTYEGAYGKMVVLKKFNKSEPGGAYI
jgi:hypothetical protein